MTWHHPALAKRTIDSLDDELKKLREENAKMREAMAPVLTIYAPPPQSPTESESFGNGGCPLDKNHIRKMQECLGMMYQSGSVTK